MKNDKIRWGIIGCGDVAEVKSGPAFSKVPRSELIAVMRRNGEKARDFAERHNVPYWYDDAGQILNHPDINAVYIATPPSSHVDYAIRAIHEGKDVYLEKPLARSSKEARKIKQALEGRPNKVVVAHYRRRMEAFLKVGELLESMVIGDVRLVDVRILQSAKTDLIADTEDNWRVDPGTSGGGYFFDLAPHQIDLMLKWFGEPESASGFSSNQQGIYPANDVVNGLIKFKNRVHFRGVWVFNVADTDQMDKCIIYGSKGSISFSFFGDKVMLTTSAGEEVFDIPAIPHVQQPLIEATVNYFLNSGTNPCPLHEAIAGLEVMEVFSSQG